METKILFIPATPDSKLKSQLQEELKRKNAKIKVVEKSGTKLVRLLQRNDPFKEKRCPDTENCFVCNGEKPGGCRDTSVVYQISCTGGCGHTYVGQTASNGYTRGIQHKEKYDGKSEESALWKHCINDHNEHLQKFEMRILDRCRGDTTKRQIIEFIRIQKAQEETLMNGRSEWNTARIPRFQVRTDIRN